MTSGAETGQMQQNWLDKIQDSHKQSNSCHLVWHFSTHESVRCMLGFNFVSGICKWHHSDLHGTNEPWLSLQPYAMKTDTNLFLYKLVFGKTFSEIYNLIKQSIYVPDALNMINWNLIICLIKLIFLCHISVTYQSLQMVLFFDS